MGAKPTPTLDAFTTGSEPIGAIDSPTTIEKYRVVLRDGTQPLHLQQQLITCEVTTESTDGRVRRHLQLGQVRDLELRNHHHETPLFRPYLRAHLEIPGLSGRADHRVATVYPVDAVVLDEEGEVVEKTGALSVLPPTGTVVAMASDAVIGKFIGRQKGLLRVGYLAKPTHLPLALPHNATGDEGAAEARHYGCFGPSGSGKTTMVGHLMTGWARHEQMGMFVLDHDGDLSRLEIGRDANTGEVHFSLARAFAAVGRDPAAVIRVNRSDLRVEAPRDIATALRIERFLERLGVGAGEKRHSTEVALEEMLVELLSDVASFADLDYNDAIGDICQACASVYASRGRAAKQQEFLDVATGGQLAEKRLREIWKRVQGYASAPLSMRELVEQALFDGAIVIVNLSGADGSYDEMLTKRLVQTLLDVAHLSYVLKQEGQSAETWRGRYSRYRPYFDRYRDGTVNAIAVIDEAHMVASQDDVDDEGSVAAQLAVAIRRTRKFGLGFCFATQEIGTIARSIFRNLGTYIFGYGLKTASEADRVQEVLADESAFRLYRGLPEPKSSGRYSFMVSGAAVPLANGAPLVLTAYSSQDEFFRANPRLHDPGRFATPEPPMLRPASAPPAAGIDTLRRAANQ